MFYTPRSAADWASSRATNCNLKTTMSGWTSNTNTSGAPRTVTGTEASGNPAFKRTRPLVQTCDPLCFVFSWGRVFLLHTDPRKAAQRPLYWIWLPIRTCWTWSHSHLMASCVQRLKDEVSNIDHLATVQCSSGKPSCGCSLTPRTTQTPSPMAAFPPAGRCTPQKPQNPGRELEESTRPPNLSSRSSGSWAVFVVILLERCYRTCEF